MSSKHKPFGLGIKSAVSAVSATLAPVVFMALGAGSALGAPEWRDGSIETNRYAILREGVKEGRIEQHLYGVTEKGVRCFRAVFDLVRRAARIQNQDVIGRSTIDVVFSAADFAFLHREDSYAVADSEGRIRSVRTPKGVTVRGESAAQSIPEEDVAQEIEFTGPGPLIDHFSLVYFVRSLPLQEGRTFEVATVVPRRKAVDHMKGRVGASQTMDWNGGPITVRRIDVSSPNGTSAYYVREDAAHTLVRYVSSEGEVYQLETDAGA